jgi:hypothetical protein
MNSRNAIGPLVLGLALASPAIAAIPRPEAERAVADVRLALARYRGRLWGVDLSGPILFVEPATHEALGTDPDSAGRLAADGTMFAGKLPSDINPANTALHWGGRHWSMVMWPIPADTVLRRTLLIHELWHRVQADLGLPMTGPSNAHLDTPDGRLWLQLEWRALAAALAHSGDRRERAIADALAFRAVRRGHFPNAAADERALERHEGLAEYTGVRLASATPGERAARARTAIAESKGMASFVRSFAYVSGPAYGLLLDDARPDWRRALGGDADLGELLRRAVGLPPPDSSAAAAERRAAPYQLDSLRAAEGARERKRQEKLAELRRRFVDGPTLRLPLQSPKVSFDPYRSQPLDSLGTVYGGMRVSERWGVLDAPQGALIASDWMGVTVQAPTVTAGDTLRGPGWSLELRPEWELIPGATPGSWKLAAKK